MNFLSDPISGDQGTLTAIRDWFRDYKIPDGKPANRFGLGDKPANKVSSSFFIFSNGGAICLVL